MSGICRLAPALALCGAFAAARGDSMKVSVWRGESASFFVSDEYPEIGGIAIDNYSQILVHVDKPFLAEVADRRKAGQVTTYYVCCGPVRPNTFMSSGPGEAFTCGFYPAACGLDGFLRWAYNSWGEDSNNDMTYSRWTAGDVALVYPDGSPSWRFLELRNGIVAAEKFRILREAGGRDAELDALAAKFDLKKLLDGTDYEALRRAVLDVVNR